MRDVFADQRDQRSDVRSCIVSDERREGDTEKPGPSTREIIDPGCQYHRLI